jgi:short-subunit dehydrogenase
MAIVQRLVQNRIDRRRFGPWALVTGASSGIGRGFARHLAASGLNVVLVARRRRLLEGLSAELAGEFGVEARVVETDVTEQHFLEAIRHATDDLEVGLLVSAAGAPLTGAFLDTDVELVLRHVRLDVVPNVELTHHFAARMAARRRGGVLLVSAMGVEHGAPLMAASFAGKSYVLILGRSLHAEFGALGISTTVLLPGPTATDAINAIGFDLIKTPFKPMPVDKCVAEALDALAANRPTILSGRINRFMYSVVPSTVIARMSGRMIGQAIAARTAARAAS